MKKITFLMAALLVAVSSIYAQNLAIGKTTTASTEIQVASNAVDGDPDGRSRWESASEDPQWITIDLEESTAIGRVVLDWEGAYGKEYKIQVSENNADWTDIYTETNSDGGIDDITLSGTGRYIRMYGTVRGTPWGYSLYEFEVYAPIATEKDASLDDIMIDGVSVEGFASGISSYSYGLLQGTTTVPEVTVSTSNESANAVVTEANTIPGTTTIEVTSSDLSTTATYTVQFIIDTPSSAAPTPAQNEANVISVYSDNYSNNLMLNSNPYWGQTTVVTEEDLESDYALKYADLNYQGMEYTSTDVSGMEYVHLDYFTGDATELQFAVISEGPLENAYDIAANEGIVTGQWVSLNIPLTEYSTPDLTKAFQFKTVGNGTIYLDNLYFWKGTTTAVSELDSEALSIAPNPVMSILEIKGASTIDKIELFDLSGKIVMAEFPANAFSKLDVSSLAKGIYVAKITMGGVVKTQKIIKQ